MDLVKAIIKLAIIGSIVYTEIKKNVGNIGLWYTGNLFGTINLLGNSVFNLAIKIGIILLIFAILDYGYEWWRYELDLMMTKQEVKDEYKLMEGDPQVRSRIRAKQRELGMRRMMQEIPKQMWLSLTLPIMLSLSVITSDDDAPVVVAKVKVI